MTIRTRLSPGLQTRRRPADDPVVTDAALPPEEALARAYAEYRSAMRSWRSAAKAEHAESEERAADRLLTARVVLYRCLLATGWHPPAAVEVQLDRDVALVEAPQDFEALLGV